MLYFDDCIKPALERFYKKDKYLIENDVHEQTISARIAKYIEDVIEDMPNTSDISRKLKNLNVDCEFNKNLGDIKTIYGPRKIKIRPDIIVHKRRTNQRNRFVIEIKKKIDICDEQKVKMIVRELGYEEGYALQNIKKTSFHLYFYSNSEPPKGIDFRVARTGSISEVTPPVGT